MIIFLVFTFWKHKVLPKYKATGAPPRRKTMACLSEVPWMEEPGVQMEAQMPGSAWMVHC